MAHITLDRIIEWEKQENKYTFNILSKDGFDAELKRYPPERGEQDTPHTHDMDELYYIISGTGKVRVGEEETYTINEGEMVFVEKGDEHEFYEREEEIVVLKILAGS